ncbi:EFR1 family ferrodoxin, partial [Candidatus Bipolaricaulota bacterium]|nr:EFR1 family ferrodoxin [Candidatus Bipolaricaulota bacterium]
SASGNALAIGRAIAKELGETELLPIAGSMGGFAGTDEERIGIVTPVYAWGLPRLVTDFVKTFRTREGQYVFGIATCGGTQGATLGELKKRLRRIGSHLDAGFAVRGDFQVSLPGMDDIAIISFVQRIAKRLPGHFADRRDEIVRAVADKARRAPEKSEWSVNAIGSIMHGGAMNMFKKGDKDFSVSDACVSCGTCAKVCPRENVTLVNDRPTWRQNCEMCYACMLWCPQKAIALKRRTPVDPTHHPAVELADMLLR